MSGHTPGPWTVKRFDECQTVVLAGDRLVCIVPVGEGKPAGAANAVLIAAAPDLIAERDAAREQAQVWERIALAHMEAVSAAERAQTALLRRIAELEGKLPEGRGA